MIEDRSKDAAAETLELLQRIKQQEKQIVALQQSRSWRVTSPLRWLKRVARDLTSKPFKKNLHSPPMLKDYTAWMQQFDSFNSEASSNLLSQIVGFANVPLISVLLPLGTSNVGELRATLDSVMQQLYPNWELCVVTSIDTSVDVHVLLSDYARLEPRIKIANGQAKDIVQLSNQALSMVSNHSGWLINLNAITKIANKLMFIVAIAINKFENCQIIYADEAVYDAQGQCVQPDFKPDWNPELHHSRDIIGRSGIYRTALVRQLGGYQTGMSEAIDFDLSLRCLENVTADQVVHLPYVLFQGAYLSPQRASEMGVQALNSHFQRLAIAAHAENIDHGYRIHYALPIVLPLVSIIIPTRNGVDLLRMCIESIQTKTSYTNYEIIIVDNGSDDQATLAYFRSLAKELDIRILRIDTPFNYSALNNTAVKASKGELIALVNNDIVVISQNWLCEMVSHALRSGVGAVGARLWFPNDTLQHGGVVLGMGGVAGHAHMGLPRDQLGYQGRAGLVQNMSAVTAACLVIKKSIYEAVGGLNENDLAVAFNDVDFCLRVREAGYRNVWTPFAELYHHESASRGYEDTLEKQERFSKEMAYMHQRWGQQLQADPAYSPNLMLQKNDFSVAWPPRVPSLLKQVSSQPGQLPLADRIAQLKKGGVRVAYFAENVHSGTFRYRAENMTAVLNDTATLLGVNETSAACFFLGDLEYASQIVKNADILVISRARYDPSLAALVQSFQSQGKRVLFDIDDLVFDTQMIDVIIRTSGQAATDDNLHYWYGVVGRMAQMLKLCDGAIATNAFLANKIQQFANLPACIVPNFANKAQLAVSKPLYQRKLTQNMEKSQRIRLGYFSGSATHNVDLALLSNALERVMAIDKRIDLVLVGHVDLEQAFGVRFGGYFKGHMAHRLTMHPFVDYVTLQERIAEVDFNLVPLQVNDFTNCKSELKYVDAAIVGTLTIASASYAYAQAIRHGENGYIATDDCWESVLLEAIANKDKVAQVHADMVSAAYLDVQHRFTWKTQHQTIMQALGLS